MSHGLWLGHERELTIRSSGARLPARRRVRDNQPHRFTIITDTDAVTIESRAWRTESG